MRAHYGDRERLRARDGGMRGGLGGGGRGSTNREIKEAVCFPRQRRRQGEEKEHGGGKIGRCRTERDRQIDRDTERDTQRERQRQ